MRLVTLGGLRLEGSEFADPQPLLVLTFIALEGECLRGELKELFWPWQRDSVKRSKSLSEVVRRLKRVDAHLVEPGRDPLASYISVDARTFQGAVVQKRFEDAHALYGGTFLRGLERKRLRLGEEVEAWLAAKRAELQADYVRVLLALADESSRQGEPEAARDYILQALALPEEVAPLSLQVLTRMRDLFLRLGCEAEAARVDSKVHDDYGQFKKGLEQVRSSHVTAYPTLVGREAELTELARCYGASHRLVTVTGLAGIGKTALAKAFMRQAFPYFDNAYFIPMSLLTSKATPLDLWQRLAQFLGVSANAEQLSDYLRGKTLLLVFDNFEPWLALRSVLAELWRNCPGVSFLVTSRERLGLEGEHVLRLEGLGLPDRVSTLTDLGRSDSGRLLLAEVQRRGLTFHDSDVPLLVELCQQTAGVPLVLKLAAGWLPSLPLSDLIEHLENSLNMLTDSVMSMEATLEVSVGLLEPDARSLFTQLGVFEGGFSFEAAETLLEARPQMLKRLVDASLLEFSEYRYILHPLVSCYLSERFELSTPLKVRHADYFLSALQDVLESDQPVKDQAVRRLREDLGNLTVAWDWTLQRADVEAVKSYLPALQRLFDLLARAHLGLELMDRSLENHVHLELAPHFNACRAWFLLRLGRYKEVITVANLALADLPEPCTARETCLNALGAAHDSLGQFAEAKRTFEASLHLAEPKSGEAATALTNLAINAIHQGDYEAAHLYLTRATASFTTQGKRAKLVWCAYLEGWLALETGNLPKARVKLEQTLLEAKTLGLRHWALLSEIKRARLYALEGRTEYAQQQCLQVLEDVRAHKLINKEIRILATLGAIVLNEDPVTALSYYSASLHVSQSTQSEPVILQSLVGILDALNKHQLPAMYEPLYRFCANRRPTMFYADRLRFDRLTSQSENFAWDTLATGEGASLTLSLLAEAGVPKHPRHSDQPLPVS